MAALDSVLVHVDLERFQHPVSMGVLHRQQSGAGEIFSFEYDRAWLDRPEVFAFDPDLALAAGHQYPAANRKNFGIFLDSPPDRVGPGVDATPREYPRPTRKKKTTCPDRVGLSPWRSRRNSFRSVALSSVTRRDFH
jgi:hypothetical protein